MAALTPREKRQRRTRNEILDAARQIISREGPEKLSMRRLARRIDYSPAGLYEYFDSKDAIVLAVCVQGHERLANYLRQVDMTLAPVDYLLALGLSYIRFAIENPDFYLLMFTHRPTKDGVQEKLEDVSTYGILQTAVERGIEAGVFKTSETQDSETISYAAWTLVHGISMVRITILSDYAAEFDTADRAALNVLIRGFMTV
ncbi:MAG: TetR/AcrR family transcriptional regulator [Candidatus Promineifilaceae bacterium]